MNASFRPRGLFNFDKTPQNGMHIIINLSCTLFTYFFLNNFLDECHDELSRLGANTYQATRAPESADWQYWVEDCPAGFSLHNNDRREQFRCNFLRLLWVTRHLSPHPFAIPFFYSLSSLNFFLFFSIRTLFLVLSSLRRLDASAWAGISNS